MRQRIYAAALTVMMAVLALGPMLPAEARRQRANSSEKLWRVGTYLGSAATIYGLAKGNDTLALVGGGATLLSYLQWKKQVKARHQRADQSRYRAYRTQWLKRHRGRRVVRR